MKIFTAVIENEYGMDVYVDVTPEGLQNQINEFVKLYWHELEIEGPMPEDTMEAFELYFENHPIESVTYAQAELDGVEEVRSTSMMDDVYAEFENNYENQKFLDAVDKTLAELTPMELKEVWNIFDNADGSEQRYIAVEDALRLIDLDPYDYEEDEE